MLSPKIKDEALRPRVNGRAWEVLLKKLDLTEKIREENCIFISFCLIVPSLKAHAQKFAN